jgi:hypothetical protein
VGGKHGDVTMTAAMAIQQGERRIRSVWMGSEMCREAFISVMRAKSYMEWSVGALHSAVACMGRRGYRLFKWAPKYAGHL